jgi:predicted metal-dependent hydrolase
MTASTVRRLHVDLQAPIARHWCGGDPLRTALFNALSMSFPVGEQFFIDAVRNGFEALPADRQEQHSAELRVFVGQEATHRRVHTLFNEHLERQGLRNRWAPRALARMKMFEGADPRHALAMTAANEHFTALLAEWLLGHPALLEGTEPRLQTLWLWHASEEAEHKATAFDIYHALRGNRHWRMVWFRRATVMLVSDLTRQTLRNLHDDGSLWQKRTWVSAFHVLLGRGGLLRTNWRPWLQYLRRDFHPDQLTSHLASQWLERHREAFTPLSPDRS